jgi:hypothetical protein
VGRYPSGRGRCGQDADNADVHLFVSRNRGAPRENVRNESNQLNLETNKCSGKSAYIGKTLKTQIYADKTRKHADVRQFRGKFVNFVGREEK